MNLTNRQQKNADRVGGIRLMILWPAALGPEPTRDRPSTPAEHAWAERELAAYLPPHQPPLIVVRSWVEIGHRPNGMDIVAPGEVRAHLVVSLIGQRWVKATGPGAARYTVSWA